MIAALTGRLVAKAPTHVTLDVHGVGYEVFIPLSTFYGLPELNEAVSLSIHTHLREDALQLFGFASAGEKETFLLLTSISGIGPKLALSVLSALSVPDLVKAIQAGDVDRLATVPGIGKKSAGRIALELKDKVQRVHPVAPTTAAPGPPASALQEDAISALVNLGYRSTEAKDVVKRVLDGSSEPPTLKDVIRDALKELVKA